MDLKTLRATVRRILFDQAAPTASRWSDDDLNRFLNEALLEVSRAAKRRKIQDYSLTAGSESIALPQDLLRLDAVLWKDNGAASWSQVAHAETPYPLDDEEYYERLYWVIGSNMVFRPVPETPYTVRLGYFYKFPDLAADTDVPEPANVDGILIAYAMWQALDFDGSPLSAIWQQKFTQQITGWALAEQRKYRRRMGTITVIR